MSARHADKANEIDPRGVEVRFSAEVRRAFSDLAAAVHFSEHFDRDTLRVVQNWATDKPQSVSGVLSALPSVAEETFEYIHATGDKRAAEAWSEIAKMMPEKGFTLTKHRGRP